MTDQTAPNSNFEQPNQNPSEQDAAPGAMGFFEHFNELRQRLFKAVLALVLATVATSVFTPTILKYLAEPYDGDLVILTPTGSVVMYFRVALMSGGIISIPFITYQLMMFIMPGLTKAERRWVMMALPATTGFFLLGVAFAWFIMVPSALGFLQGFQDDIFLDQWTAQEYFSFLTTIIFWIGVAFEMPIVFYVLGRLGFVTSQTLIHHWRLAVVIISIMAAVITPTVDPFNMLLVMAPLLVLYVLSIGLVAISRRKSNRNDATA